MDQFNGGGSLEAFYLAAARAGLHTGHARLFGLSVDGVWIATSLGLIHGGAFHGIVLAMAGQWRAYSPGIRLASHIMVWSREQGLDYFDMTVGALSYKSALGAEAHDLYEVSDGVGLRGRLLVALRRAPAAAKAWIERHPQLAERLRAARRAVRRRLGR